MFIHILFQVGLFIMLQNFSCFNTILKLLCLLSDFQIFIRIAYLSTWDSLPTSTSFGSSA